MPNFSENKENINPGMEEKIREAFDLLKVSSFRELSRVYGEKDQELMKTRTWDDKSPELITNRVKNVLEQMNPAELSEEDRMWWHEIMWFWYHHAISYAIWKRKDKQLAQLYADKALELQMPDHPNKITKLLWFLVRDKLEEVKEWMKTEKFIDYEFETAQATLKEYENGEFFV